MFCANCGNPVVENAQFCKFCGKKLQAEAERNYFYVPAFSDNLQAPAQCEDSPAMTAVATVPEKSKKKTGMILGIIGASLAVVAIAFLLIFVSVQKSDAKDLLVSNQWEGLAGISFVEDESGYVSMRQNNLIVQFSEDGEFCVFGYDSYSGRSGDRAYGKWSYNVFQKAVKLEYDDGTVESWGLKWRRLSAHTNYFGHMNDITLECDGH